ncbi:hypothetical protein D3C81_1876580 [compost metagenome]
MLIPDRGLQLVQLKLLSMLFPLQEFALVGQFSELFFEVVNGVGQQAFLIGVLLCKKDRNRTVALDT